MNSTRFHKYLKKSNTMVSNAMWNRFKSHSTAKMSKKVPDYFDDIDESNLYLANY